MIFAHGQLLPDSALPGLLAGLEGEINETRAPVPSPRRPSSLPWTPWAAGWRGANLTTC